MEEYSDVEHCVTCDGVSLIVNFMAASLGRTVMGSRTEERWVTALDFGGSEQLCTRCIALSSDAEVPVAIDERPVSTWPEERTPNVRPDVFDHGSAERSDAEPDSRAFGNAPMIESTPARLADLSNSIQRVLVCHFMRPENQPVLLREIADGCDQIINSVALYRDFCDSFEYLVKEACFDNLSVYFSRDSRTQRVWNGGSSSTA